MTTRVDRAGLAVDKVLADFIEEQALPGTGVDPGTFWDGLAELANELGPKNRALLDKREAIQTKIDDWHRARNDQGHDAAAYKAFLEEIGYLLPEGEDFEIGTENVDPEIATVPGPQLVVPVTNARFALNAANARWGSRRPKPGICPRCAVPRAPTVRRSSGCGPPARPASPACDAPPAARLRPAPSYSSVFSLASASSRAFTTSQGIVMDRP